MKIYDKKQCALYKCKSKKRLAQILFFRRDTANILNNLDGVIKYSRRTIAKKNDKRRNILEPSYSLKNIQRRILKLLTPIKRPDWVIGGEKGKSYINNAEYHQMNSYILKLDIKSFFDNCKRDYIFKFFRDYFDLSNDIAKILTDLTTYDGKIPSGAPTSSLLSFYAYKEMFYEISEIAIRNGCKFSLYIDDLTISKEQHFDKDIIINEIQEILKKYKHSLNVKKTKYYSETEHCVVTGVAISYKGETKVPNKLRIKILETFSELKNIGCKKRCNCNKCLDLKNSLRGMLNSARNIENKIFIYMDNYL